MIVGAVPNEICELTIKGGTRFAAFVDYANENQDMKEKSPPCKVEMKITRLPGFVRMYNLDELANELADKSVFTDRCANCPEQCNEKHERLAEQCKTALIAAMKPYGN